MFVKQDIKKLKIHPVGSFLGYL